MRNYVTKRDEKELWDLWKQIKLLKSLNNGNEFTIELHGREIYNPDFNEKYTCK